VSSNTDFFPVKHSIQSTPALMSHIPTLYDIAVYPWSISLAKQDSKLWEAFLEGYTQQRDVGELDLAAVPLFVAIRHIWLLGLHTGNGDDWGYGWLTNRYFGRQMKFLREWVAEQIDWT
jgi:Ser/Thr protein kinase RdoA (MazF antagonist)